MTGIVDPETGTRLFPETFFRVVLPLALGQKRDVAKSVNGLITFAVAEAGIGTADLREKGDGKVRPGAALRPDVLIAMEASLFGPFIRGAIDHAGAARAGKLVVVGDADVLRRFSQIWKKVGKAAGSRALAEPQNPAMSLRSPKKKRR